VYDVLLERYPGEDVWLEIMKQIGTGDYPQSLAVRAALNYAKSTEGSAEPLSELAGEVLLNSLRHRGAYGEGSKKIRALLYTRYPKSIEVSRKFVTDNNYEHRGNSFFLLKESGKLTDAEAMQYHFYNLMHLNSSYRGAHEEAAAYFQKSGGEPDWLERKQAAGLVVPENPPVFNSFSLYDQASARVMTELFMPEVQPLLISYLESDISAQRVNAWYMLTAAGKKDLLDADRFHAKTLKNFDARYTPRYFVEAVEYFKKRGKGDSGLAKRALLDGAVHIQKLQNEYSFASGWRKTIDSNLKLVQRALRGIK
jgi:hypothetical protein